MNNPFKVLLIGEETTHFGEIKYDIVKAISDCSEEKGIADFQLSDIHGVLKELGHDTYIRIRLVTIKEEYRHKGYGTKIVQDFIANQNPEFPIMVRAGILSEDMEELRKKYSEDKELETAVNVVVSGNVAFWEKNGFEDINDLSCFESSVSMIQSEYAPYIHEYVEKWNENKNKD